MFATLTFLSCVFFSIFFLRFLRIFSSHFAYTFFARSVSGRKSDFYDENGKSYYRCKMKNVKNTKNSHGKNVRNFKKYKNLRFL